MSRVRLGQTPQVFGPRRGAWLFALGLASANLSLSSCATPGEMVAIDGSRRWVASDPSKGLTLVATTGAWTGSPFVNQNYSVIHVLIDNRGSAPVLIAPGDFQLRNEFGFIYPIADAGGTFRRVYENQDYLEQREYDRGHDNPITEVNHSDPEFARAALPWGVLEPGAQLRGFLYFHKLSKSANRGTLLWQAQTPQHAALSNLGFEIYVARKVDQKRSQPPSTTVP